MYGEMLFLVPVIPLKREYLCLPVCGIFPTLQPPRLPYNCFNIETQCGRTIKGDKTSFSADNSNSRILPYR